MIVPFQLLTVAFQQTPYLSYLSVHKDAFWLSGLYVCCHSSVLKKYWEILYGCQTLSLLMIFETFDVIIIIIVVIIIILRDFYGSCLPWKLSQGCNFEKYSIYHY